MQQSKFYWLLLHKVLAHVTSDISLFANDDNTLLRIYRNNQSINYVTSADMLEKLHQVVIQINLPAKGFLLSRILLCSLRARGTIALVLVGYNALIIQKHGCWSFSTFLACIYEEIVHLGSNVWKVMGVYRPFYNITGFT